MQARYLGYGGLFAFLLSLVLFIVASEERQFESTVARVKGIVIAKRIYAPRIRKVYEVTYRVTIQGKTLERDGNVGSREAWDAVRIGDEIEAQSIGDTPGQIRLPSERVASSTAYRILSAGMGLAGIVLIILRVRKGKRHG